MFHDAGQPKYMLHPGVPIPEPTLHTRIEMFWADDGKWYGSAIIDYDHQKKEHCVFYPDEGTDQGTVEWLAIPGTGEDMVEWRKGKDQTPLPIFLLRPIAQPVVAPEPPAAPVTRKIKQKKPAKEKKKRKRTSKYDEFDEVRRTTFLELFLVLRHIAAGQ